MKVLALNDPQAFATWLFGRRPSTVEPIDPGLAIVTKRIGDKLFLGRFAEGDRTLLHVEVQLKGDPEIGRRMLICAGLIDRVREASGFEGCLLDQVVIYLDRLEYRDDPGVFVVPKREGKRALVEYRVIRAWEVDPQEILQLDSHWLDPLVALTDVEDAVMAVVELRDRTLARGLDPQEQSDVLVCLAGLAAIVVPDEERLLKIFGGIDMGGNVFIEHWIKKGRQKGREEGRQEGRQEALAEAAELVLEVLAGRFGEIPSDVTECVRALRDFAHLRALGRAAGQAATLDEFRAAL
ncbi:MAG: hypothetical protein JXP34_14800 [Planctomycetes bacterium]|nr:hypothetical protein [Planctomycetota bacterium]